MTTTTKNAVDVTSETAGAATVPWTNAANAENAPDSSYARATFVFASEESYYLWFDEFGFSVDSGDDSIDGIEVKIKNRGITHSGGDITVQDKTVSLVNEVGTIVGDNKAVASDWPTTYADATYGGAADLWASGIDTESEVNDPDFGFVLQTHATAGSMNDTFAEVDAGEITLTYTLGDAYVPGQGASAFIYLLAQLASFILPITWFKVKQTRTAKRVRAISVKDYHAIIEKYKNPALRKKVLEAKLIAI